ncbi:MAG: ATP-binding protein [Ignavibacteriae bacterium]|nr:ATP-binding protein [Ignavibacteriota bacterium]
MKENLRDAIVSQRREFERAAAEPFVVRRVDNRALQSPLVKVIIGPRRAGKSFYAQHALQGKANFAYVNFDDERLATTDNCDDILAALRLVYGETRSILMDEIQNLPRWELFVNRLHREGYNVVITGSNAKLLSRELATHLTGRHIPISIFPFSFSEFIAAAGREFTASEMAEQFTRYVESTGYPEPVVKRLDARAYLSTLFESILYKDIVKRHAIRFSTAIDDLGTYVLSNVAKEYSFKTLAVVSGAKSDQTVKNYLSYLEEAFLIFSINRFSFKVKEQVASNKKLYCIDNGFIHARAFKTSPDYGRLCENVVAIELRRRELNGEFRFTFWKNAQQEEVDFVLREGTQTRQLIQVCTNIDAASTRVRELRSLLKASKELKCDDLLVLTGSYEATETTDWFGIHRVVKFTPIWKWLLEN